MIAVPIARSALNFPTVAQPARHGGCAPLPGSMSEIGTTPQQRMTRLCPPLPSMPVIDVLDQLFDAVRPAGVIVNVSIWSEPATIDMQKLVLKEIDLRGTVAYVRDHPASIKLVQDGKVSLAPFITAKIALERLIDDGFETLIHHNDTAVKIIVHP